MKVAVVGVPKTIDNDILLMDKTFGFDTAVEEAQKAINAAYIEVCQPFFTLERLPSFCIPPCPSEDHQFYFNMRWSSAVSIGRLYMLMDVDVMLQANSAYNGIGIVKLMGRQSGFIAMHASLASGQVDVCLIPEVL